jgi:hypothetical protein
LHTRAEQFIVYAQNHDQVADNATARAATG